MTLKECYDIIGNDVNEVCERLLNETIVQKFVLKFLDISDFDNLKNAMENKDWDQAFLSVHTIKGIAQNLGFSQLGQVSSDLTEKLRNHKPESAAEEAEVQKLFAIVSDEFNRVFSTVQQFKDSL